MSKIDIYQWDFRRTKKKVAVVSRDEYESIRRLRLLSIYVFDNPLTEGCFTWDGLYDEGYVYD